MGDRWQLRLWQYASSLDPAENRAALDRVPALAEGADLVVLPEAFARDFGEAGSDLAPYAETLGGPFATRLQEISAGSTATLVAGMFEQSTDPARPYNTVLIAEAGRLTPYRKIHLYDSFGHRETDRVHPGPIEPVVVATHRAEVGVLTCYDLRFPELARALSRQGMDVLVVPAAWVQGAHKLEQWRTLLRARAVENLVWVVATGQPGPRYTGHSMVIAPTGDVVAEAGPEETVLCAELDLTAVRQARQDNTSLLNRRL